MATQDYTPHLKRVLRSYQSTAMTSLHGPGTIYLNVAGGRGVSDKVTDFGEDNIKSFKQCIKLYEDSLKNKVEDSPRRCAADDAAECRRGPTPSSPPTRRPPTPSAREPDLPEGKDPDGALPSAAPLRSPSPPTPAPATPQPPAPADALAAAPSAPTAGAASIKSPAAGSASDSSAGFGGSWVEPGVFLAPAPFPPQPWPVLAAADKGSPGSSRGCEETLLDGEPIACFNVGGERRLCLPQILNTVLREFSLWQINNVCDELRIFCSRSTPSQLDALRVAGVLPHTATSCGLITHTDAQRLTQALLYAHPSRSPAPAPAQSQQASPQLRVYHTCFGKCKGLVWDDLYASASAACIECEECHGLFPPARFVCHAHRSLENQTIHWGFDAENWRTYLLLAKDQRQPLEKAELLLKAFKSKFDPAGANHKRKQDGVEVKEELPKKVRAEELPPGAPLPSSVGYDPIVWSYMWRQYAAMAPSWTATPLVTRDGKALPPPPPAFVRDSVPAPLPAYLSQGPPVLVDPGRVVPLSDSQKFERHYQPNVALAPPKVRDKAARVSLKDLSTAHLSQDAHEKIAIYMQEQQQLERGVEVECIKRECSPTPMCLQRSTPNAVAAVTPSAPPHLRATPTHQPPQPPRKVCSPDTSSRHPELELSTTDSDTDSVGSVSNRSETVEEAEALLRGWSDRAAASKVAQLVADLATRLAVQERQNAALRQRFDAQTRDHNHAVASLRNQLLSINVTRDTKEEDQLRQKVCAMEGELRALRAELRPRPTPSVIAPTSPVKTEPCDVTDTC